MEVDLTELLLNNIDFIFTKFGDGEIICMSNEYDDGMGNCDNQIYSTTLSEKLVESLDYFSEKENVFLGEWIYDRFSDKFNNLLGEKKLTYTFVDYEILLHSYTNKNIVKTIVFYKQIAALNKRKLYICNKFLSGASDFLKCDIYEIQSTNAFSDYQKIKEELIEIQCNYDIIMYSAGLMSKVLIKDLHSLNKSKTHIDIGSGLDGIYIGFTRSNQIDKKELDIIYR